MSSRLFKILLNTTIFYEETNETNHDYYLLEKLIDTMPSWCNG